MKLLFVIKVQDANQVSSIELIFWVEEQAQEKLQAFIERSMELLNVDA